jgi:hypothetical protein
MPRMRITARLHRTPPPSGHGGIGAVEGPAIFWCRKPYPGGDDKTVIVGYHNLPADANVVWTLTPAGEDIDIIGPNNAHICVVRSQGSAGTISGTVNGEPAGEPVSINFADCPE